MDADNNLTVEELQIIIDDDELFDEYDLGNMYSVLQKGNERSCSVCNLIYKDNIDKFYSYNNTYCRRCNKINTQKYYNNNKVKMNIYANNYNKKKRSMYSIG
jgi:hypothetical protein